jgi:hypothetical protein
MATAAKRAMARAGRGLAMVTLVADYEKDDGKGG